MQSKLKRNASLVSAPNKLSPVPTVHLARVAAPAVAPSSAPPPSKSTVGSFGQGHVSVPNGMAKDGRLSSILLNKYADARLESGTDQRPSRLLSLSADPQPATSAPVSILDAQVIDRKRKNIEDLHNFAAVVPSSRPSKPVQQQHNKAQRSVGPNEGVVFNAPKTIEEIRAQKKVKRTETNPGKDKPPASGPAMPAAKVIPEPPAWAGTLNSINATDTSDETKSVVATDANPKATDQHHNSVIEDEEIDDFDIDIVDDDDDFEAQMRALEEAL
jgi:hypothetical protein